jgi:hypothetical protein
MNGVVGVALVALAVALIIESARAMFGRAPVAVESRVG